MYLKSQHDYNFCLHLVFFCINYLLYQLVNVQERSMFNAAHTYELKQAIYRCGQKYRLIIAILLKLNDLRFVLNAMFFSVWFAFIVMQRERMNNSNRFFCITMHKHIRFKTSSINTNRCKSFTLSKIAITSRCFFSTSVHCISF